MIKGVNKHIIEVKNPESIYFEKAVFYLKPNIDKISSEISEREINRFAVRAGNEYGRKRRSFGKIVIYSCILLMIAVTAAILLIK